MAVQVKLSTDLMFEDGTTKTMSLSPYKVTDTAVSNFKTNVMKFNADAVPVIGGVITSKNGAEISKIKAATITTTDATVIYAKSQYFREQALKKAYAGGAEDNG